MNLIYLQILALLFTLIVTYTLSLTIAYWKQSKDHRKRIPKTIIIFITIPLELKARLFHWLMGSSKEVKGKPILKEMGKLINASRKDLIIYIAVTFISLALLLIIVPPLIEQPNDLGQALPEMTKVLIYNTNFAQTMIIIQSFYHLLAFAILFYISAHCRIDALSKRCVKVSLRVSYILMGLSTIIVLSLGWYFLHHMIQNPL